MVFIVGLLFIWFNTVQYINESDVTMRRVLLFVRFAFALVAAITATVSLIGVVYVIPRDLFPGNMGKLLVPIVAGPVIIVAGVLIQLAMTVVAIFIAVRIYRSLKSISAQHSSVQVGRRILLTLKIMILVILYFVSLNLQILGLALAALGLPPFVLALSFSTLPESLSMIAVCLEFWPQRLTPRILAQLSAASLRFVQNKMIPERVKGVDDGKHHEVTISTEQECEQHEETVPSL